MKATEIKQAFRKLGEHLGFVVNHPDYYNGPWYVRINKHRKLCSNYSTAKAWANYLKRRYGLGANITLSRATFDDLK